MGLQILTKIVDCVPCPCNGSARKLLGGVGDDDDDLDEDEKADVVYLSTQEQQQTRKKQSKNNKRGHKNRMKSFGGSFTEQSSGVTQQININIDKKGGHLSVMYDQAKLEEINLMGSRFKRFRKYLRQRCNDDSEYQKLLLTLRNRPEILPHFLIQFKHQCDQKQLDQQIHLQSASSLTEEAIKSLKSSMHSQMSSSAGPALLGNSMSFSVNSKGDFKIKGFEKAVDNVKLRNFEPKMYNQNHSDIVNLVDETCFYWQRKSITDNCKKVDRIVEEETNGVNNALRQSVRLSVKDVAVNRRVLMTKQEFEAAERIARAFKAYRLRQTIQYRIRFRGEILEGNKKKMNTIIDDSLLKANRALRELNKSGVQSDGICDQENLSSEGICGGETGVFAETLEEWSLSSMNDSQKARGATFEDEEDLENDYINC